MIPVKEFPDDYPQDIEVPPQDAVEKDISLYRMVAKSNVDENDFLPTYKDPKQKRMFSRCKNDPNVYGTSFWEDKQDLLNIVSRLPARFLGMMMCECDILSNQGVVKQTYNPSHHTVWFYKNEYPKYCRVIKK